MQRKQANGIPTTLLGLTGFGVAFLTLFAACTAVTGPRVVEELPEPDAGEAVVWVGRVDTVWVEPTEGVVRCAMRWEPGAVCWLVTDSVTVYRGSTP